MNKKRIISILLILCLLATLCACGRKKKEETGLLKIGVLEPLTGKYGAEGMRETLGIQYANNVAPTVKLGGKTYRVELTIRDNASDAARAAEAAQELVDAGCAVVLGSYGDELSAAASDVFRAAGVAAVAATCGDASLTRGNDHYFRIGALPEQQGAALAAFAQKTLGVKSAYCLVESGNAADAALARAFRTAADALGLTVVAAEFPPNSLDFTAYLNAAKEEGNGVIFAPCELRYAQRLVEQAAGLEGVAPFLADARWRDPSILAALQETELSVYVSAAYAEGADSAFDAGFKEWMTESVDALSYNGGSDAVTAESVLGYDAYFTVLGAAGMADSADKADILAILPRAGREGSAGSFTFDEDGGAVRNVLWVEKANQKTPGWELVTSAKLR